MSWDTFYRSSSGMNFNSAEAVLMMEVMPSVAAIAATSGDSQIPRVYEENCLFCNETCYTSTYQSSNLASGAAKARQVIYGAFGIRVDPSFFREFQEGLPLCSPCSSDVGSLNNMEKQLNDLEDKYDRLRSKMARSIIKVLDTSNDCVKRNTGINKSPTKLLQSFKKSEVNTLQQIVYESFHDQVLENGDETFDFKIPVRTGEPKQYRNKKLPSFSQKPEPKYKIQNSDSHQPTTSSHLSLLKNNSQVGTTTTLTSSKHFQGKINHKQAPDGSIKPQNRNPGALAGDSGTEKEMMKNLSGIRKQKSSSGEASKPKVPSETHLSGNENNGVSRSENCKNFEGELPNGFKGETITLSMSPKLFREGGYSMTGYGHDDDSGSGSGDGILTSKLNKDTTGTEAFEDGSFEDEEDIDEGSLNKYSPTLEITEYNGEVNLSNENHNASNNENARAIGANDMVPADGKELEVSSPAREYHGLVDALEIQQNNRGLYECMFCGKTFIHKYPYRDHLKTHTGEGPRCRICQKIFPKNHNLMLHMRTHTGEKPYECEVCQKGFADKSNLKVHMRVHTGERPYKCDYCNQGFVNSSRLIVHRRLHTGERPFPCDYCSRSFATSNQLSSHVKNHFNENKPFKCTECGRGYTNATSLQAHINVNHTDTA